MKTREMLTLDDVKKVAAAAEAEAQRNGWAVSIAVCDDGGHLLWLQRLDGAPPMSSEVAPGKAKAAAIARKPSKVLEDMVNGGRTAALAMPLLPLEGGELIVVNGNVIGAVGVSGVKAAEDAQVARAGTAALDAAAARRAA
ncbi:GlcG/HbpS family heme-binding protein [Azospira restricta]|uniref:Heme-binding protein n=1 Tax=Azospira restricta TaxID=404405 RepID=A0A974SQY0_9RHOO|nr:heme-binding protein [Azospira restricta]QRJ64794.1 heme-binding protein [Azospira restricta]